MNRLFLLLFLYSISEKTYSCSCRGIDDYYHFFKCNTYSFVGKVTDSKKEKDHYVYTFEVVDKLRSSFKGKVLINNKTKGVACDIYFNVGEKYILNPTKINGEYNIQRCDYNVGETETNFEEDLRLIKLFSKKDFEVDCSYFKCTVKNGKRNGKWIRYYSNDSLKQKAEEGNFINDLEDGKWKAEGYETIYKNGKLLRSIQYIGDSIQYKMEEINGKHIRYYPDGKIHKVLNYRDNSYTAYFETGKIKERGKFNKNGYLYGQILYYNNDGSLKNKEDIYNEKFYLANDRLMYED
ncbi:MAG: hypothetical protein K0S32_3161 [Bacteroidetes bacterium]|nr:hypothetical protein [Bacteroidota bacterium]